MKGTPRGEVPILTESMRQGEAARSRKIYYMLVLSCAGVAMEVVEKVPDGEEYEAWKEATSCRRSSIARTKVLGMLLDIMSPVFREGDWLQSAFEVFEKKCRLYRALSDEEVSENLKVAVVHKNLQDAELWKHLLRCNFGQVHKYQGRGHQLQLRGSCGEGNCAC